MIRLVMALLAGGAVWAGAAHAAAIRVDLTNQTMHVSSREGEFDWPISSARSGFTTPRGTYGIERLEAMHYSRKYHNSPMPHSIFFRGGYAIHGTYSVASLGEPASHGCIRIAPENAALLYGIVRNEGARIAISGSPGVEAPRYARAERRIRPARDVVYDADGRPLAYAPRFADPRPAPGYDDWMPASAPAWGGDEPGDPDD